MTAEIGQPVLDRHVRLYRQGILDFERSIAQIAEWLPDETVGKLRVMAVHAVIDAGAHGCASAHIQAWVHGRRSICRIAVSDPWWRPAEPMVLDDLSDAWRCAYGVLRFEIHGEPETHD